MKSDPATIAEEPPDCQILTHCGAETCSGTAQRCAVKIRQTGLRVRAHGPQVGNWPCGRPRPPRTIRSAFAWADCRISSPLCCGPKEIPNPRCVGRPGLPWTSPLANSKRPALFTAHGAEPGARHARDSTRLNRISIKPSAVSYLSMHCLLQSLGSRGGGFAERLRCAPSVEGPKNGHNLAREWLNTE
jgi:hypothetical protein